MINENTPFAGFQVLNKLSNRHDDRAVFLATDPDGKTVVLTVFDIRSPRYACEEVDAKDFTPEMILEIKFLKHTADFPGVARYIDSGITSWRRHRYAWVAQEKVEGERLEDVIRSRGPLPGAMALEVAGKVGAVSEAISRFTNGGAHYNLSPSNVLVAFDTEGILTDVTLVGFYNMSGVHSGASPMDPSRLDRRVQAPETINHLFNHRADVYSLSMLTLLAMTGFPTVIHGEKYSIDLTSETTDLSEMTPVDFQVSLLKHASSSLSAAQRLVFAKGANFSPGRRFSTISKLMGFLSRHSASEPQAKVSPKTEGHSQQGTSPKPALNVSAREKAAMPRTVTPDPLKHGFDEVAGMADLKAIFRRDFIRIVKNPTVAREYGIKPNNCILLYGPQGCGKTFIAEKAAQEAGLKYKVVKPSDLGSIYIHGAQQKIADVFAEAENNRPMILIFDEFDALVPKRNEGPNENQANEVNEMLTQLNNCAERGVYVLCTTNRPDRIDPAVMRKGRVDRSIYVSLPDFEARKELFRLELKHRPLSEDIDLEGLANATENFTCSDISFIVEETARQCFEETLDQGLEKPLPLSMEKIMEVAKSTASSVSETQRKEFLELKAKMENLLPANGCRKVGFV